jgi:long-chain-fatty-acid--CoA ligase ACSBG
MASTTSFWVSDLETVRPVVERHKGFTVGRTMPTALKDAVESRPDEALFVTPDGVPVSVSDFYALARRVAKGLIAAGLAPGDGACIIGFNSVEWFAADWGAMLASALPAPSYVTNSSEVVAYIMDHSRSGICFVDDEETMIKAIAAKAQMQSDACQSIVVWGSQIDLSKYRDHASYLLSWDEFLATGASIPDAAVDKRMAIARSESCAKLIYTSGTTGPPKAVMISHDNLDFICQVTAGDYGINRKDTTVSYLPASHIAANSLDCMGPVLAGVTVHLAHPDALRGSLVDTLRKVRPTCFYAVPRVWEKIQERMMGMRGGMGPIQLFLSDWAKSVGTVASDAEDRGESVPFGTFVAEKLVFSNVRKALGLDRARYIFNTAAPLQPATCDYFRSLRIKILDVRCALRDPIRER